MSKKPVVYMTPEMEARAMSLYQRGRNDRDIADELWGDWTKCYRVRDWRARNCLPAHRTPPPLTKGIAHVYAFERTRKEPPRRAGWYENHELTMRELEARAAGLSYGMYMAQKHDEKRRFSEHIRECAAAAPREAAIHYGRAVT